jgi:hypothetical protein
MVQTFPRRVIDGGGLDDPVAPFPGWWAGSLWRSLRMTVRKASSVVVVSGGAPIRQRLRSSRKASSAERGPPPGGAPWCGSGAPLFLAFSIELAGACVGRGPGVTLWVAVAGLPIPVRAPHRDSLGLREPDDTNPIIARVPPTISKSATMAGVSSAGLACLRLAA